MLREGLDTYYGMRFLYTAVAYGILINGLISINDKVGILSSFFLFLIPIALDYFNQQPLKEENYKRIQFCKWLSLTLAILVLVFMMCNAINDFVTTLWFKYGLWGVLNLFVVTALIDWVTLSSPEEMKHRKLMREAYRKSVEEYETTLTERMKYYDQEEIKKRPTRERSHTARPSETSSIVK